MRTQITQLENTVVDLRNEVSVSIKHELHETMLDVKVKNILTGVQNAQRCYICSATSRQMNNIDVLRGFPPDVQHYKYGVSPLHVLIRFMELALNISYRLGIQVGF